MGSAADLANDMSDSASAAPGTGAVGWFGLEPSAWAQAPGRGLSMALWRLDDDAPTGFRTEPMEDAHLVCVHLAGSMEWGCAVSDREYRRAALPDTFCMARAGERAEVEYSSAHVTFAHFYMPVRWFGSDEAGLTSGSAAAAIELIDPMNARSVAVGSIARRAVAALRDGGAAARLEIESAGLALAARLVRDHSSSSVSAPRRGGLASADLRRVMDYIAANLERSIGLVELAALTGLSTPHFCRAFRETVGLPPHRYQISLRLARARDLLAGTSLGIAEVASSVGYDDPTYFSRLFARESGTSPSQWRRSLFS